jgi:hypothetical protein
MPDNSRTTYMVFITDKDGTEAKMFTGKDSVEDFLTDDYSDRDVVFEDDTDLLEEGEAKDDKTHLTIVEYVGVVGAKKSYKLED